MKPSKRKEMRRKAEEGKKISKAMRKARQAGRPVTQSQARQFVNTGHY